jgi:uncharacterized protein (DUF2141 family)
MKRNRWIFGFILMMAMVSLGFEPGLATEKSGDLTIVVIGLESSDGVVRIAISNSKENYETKNAEPFRRKIVDIQKRRAKARFRDLPSGEYAVKLIHDENSNGKMDTNFLGIPKEDYAFSNNARGTFGPPDYEKAKFDLNGNLAITIRVSEDN